MIHILAQFSVKEDKVPEFIELCKELVKESRQEEGCISYNLQQNREKIIIWFLLSIGNQKKLLKSTMLQNILLKSFQCWLNYVKKLQLSKHLII